MSLADMEFKDLCQNIIDYGVSSEGQEVRPKWEDGVPAHTKSIFSHTTKYDLSEEFPAITVRKTALKSAMDEILWIYQKKSNKLCDLNSHVWDEWAMEDGTVGKSYGYQMSKKYDFPQGRMDQVDNVLWQLKNDPSSRRIMMSMYSCEDAPFKALQECAYEVIFKVENWPDYEKPFLNMMLIQRSNDVIVANNWNVCQYAILQKMFAQASDMVTGDLIHVIADAHIYDRHIPIAKELINRPVHPAPKVSLNPNIKNFYDFTVDDLIVEDYVTEPQIKNIPVAI